MRPILALMLAVQLGILLATAWAIAGRRPTAAKPSPIWSSLVISLVVVAGTSFSIADRHEVAVGAELVRFGAALLLGMALSCGLVALREGRAAVPAVSSGEAV